MRNAFLSLILLVVCGGSPVTAADADPPSAAQLADAFRKLLLPNLPNPLVEQDFNWGHQESIPNGVKWERTGIFLKPEIQRKLHNDGVWRRIAVTADDPDKRGSVSRHQRRATSTARPVDVRNESRDADPRQVRAATLEIGSPRLQWRDPGACESGAAGCNANRPADLKRNRTRFSRNW